MEVGGGGGGGELCKGTYTITACMAVMVGKKKLFSRPNILLYESGDCLVV